MVRCIVLLAIILGFTVKAFPQERLQSYDERIPGSDEVIEMVAISGGTYLIGSPPDEKGRSNDEGPQKEISINDFWMSSVEITWDQFELFLYREVDDDGAPGSSEVTIDIDGVSAATMPYVNFNRPGYPLVNVTQYAAMTFCKWLSAKTGNYYRLPTEAEWEYACRAGTTAAYSFGQDDAEIGFYAWHKGNSNNTFQKGGLKEPNGFGLYDMHGNVAEWVIDTYREDQYSELQPGISDPFSYDPDQLYPNVVRGGSWNDIASAHRCAARGFSKKSWKGRDPQFPKSLWWMTDATHVGFRIVRPKSVPSKEEMERLWGKPVNEY